MHNTSIDCDMTVKLLSESELGFLLLHDDGENPMFELLSSRTTYEDRHRIHDTNNQYVIYHLFPLLYQKNKEYTEGLAKTRNAAIQNIFTRWTEAGYNKHHAKQPYGCSSFMKYLESVEFMKADYILLMVSE